MKIINLDKLINYLKGEHMESIYKFDFRGQDFSKLKDEALILKSMYIQKEFDLYNQGKLETERLLTLIELLEKEIIDVRYMESAFYNFDMLKRLIRNNHDEKDELYQKIHLAYNISSLAIHGGCIPTSLFEVIPIYMTNCLVNNTYWLDESGYIELLKHVKDKVTEVLQEKLQFPIVVASFYNSVLKKFKIFMVNSGRKELRWNKNWKNYLKDHNLLF